MACEDDFCENYLLLKPEEASFFDLFRIICSTDLERRDFFNSRVGISLTSLRQRWLIFISVLLQKILIYLKKPMALTGSTIELLLDYPSCNGGYCRLIVNIFTGNVVRPDKSSSGFLSAVGNTDKRQELDMKIINQSSRYKPYLAIMASKLSYENQSFVQNIVSNHWQMEFLGFYDFWNDYEDQKSTQAFMFRDKTIDSKLIVVSFRGTEPFDADDWRTDIDISWYKFQGIGKIHGGFMKALGLKKFNGWPKQINNGAKSFAYYTIRDRLKTLIQENGDSKFVLAGHSLGGALAILFVGILALHEEEMLLEKLEGVYTFGQPRVGDEQFGEYMKEKIRLYDVKYYRYVYCNDLVPRIPYDDKTLLFKHFGPCLYFNSCYKGEVLGEEPNKNYFSLLYVIPKILNAVFELIRSFVLPHMKGVVYKEGWLMRLFRVTALMIPGLTNHAPVDYVNLTMLGKLVYYTHPNGSDHDFKDSKII